jgi:2-polyprenyl-3-methyl-5-hydroxy-6-metoxy-1,4-benzoquinol methylase
MPTLDVNPHYKGEQGRAYVDARLSAGPEFYSLELEYFLPYLRPADAVLEFGCGGGQLLPLLKGRVARIEAVEVNDGARERAAAFGVRLFASLGDVPREPTYDLILSNHVLEHVPDVGEVLRQLRARLKPGGRLVVKLPIDDARAPHQQSWDRHDVDHHLHTWTPRLFANQLFDAGFEVENIRVVTAALHQSLVGVRPFALRNLAMWALATIKRRRQLLAVARNSAP